MTVAAKCAITDRKGVDGQKETYMDRSVLTPTSALPEARELLSPQKQTERDVSGPLPSQSSRPPHLPHKCQYGAHMHRPHLPLEEPGGK